MGTVAATTAQHTRASIALDQILKEKGALARKIRAHFDRGRLARMRSGKRKVELQSAVLLSKLSGGRIPEKAWTIPAPPPKPCRVCGRV